MAHVIFKKQNKQETEVDALAGFKYSDNIHYVISWLYFLLFASFLSALLYTYMWKMCPILEELPVGKVTSNKTLKRSRGKGYETAAVDPAGCSPQESRKASWRNDT